MQISLFNIVFSIFRKRRGSLDNNSVRVGLQSITPSFKITVRFDNKDQTRLFIGSDSCISGNYIFEKETGIIHIGDRTFIGGGQFICINKIEIGNDVLISWGCTIIDNDAHSLISTERSNDVTDWIKGIKENKTGFYKDWTNVKHKPVIIKDKAWIGFNSIILKGVTIGEGSVVGAGSIVTKDVPDYAVVVGNPAIIIKYTK